MNLRLLWRGLCLTAALVFLWAAARDLDNPWLTGGLAVVGVLSAVSTLWMVRWSRRQLGHGDRERRNG